MLKEIQTIGNWTVHEILRQVDSNFAGKWQEKVERALKPLLVLYNNIFKAQLEVIGDTVKKIHNILNFPVTRDNTKRKGKIEDIFVHPTKEIQWIRDNLLPLLLILYFDEEKGNGFFLLGPSEENILYNLQDKMHLPKVLIQEYLQIFKRDSNDYIRYEIKKHTYKISRVYSHDELTGKNPCPDLKNSENAYFITPPLFNYIESLLDSTLPEPSQIKELILQKINSFKDLRYLYLLYKIVDRSKDQHFYPCERIAIEDPSNLPKSDRLARKYILYNDYNELISSVEVTLQLRSKFLRKFTNTKSIINWIREFLQSYKNLYTSIFLHHFNSNSCMRKRNIYIYSRFAIILFNILRTIPYARNTRIF